MKSAEFRKKRETLQLTQVQLAKLLGVSLRTILRWESGDWPHPPMAEMAMAYLALKGIPKSKSKN